MRKNANHRRADFAQAAALRRLGRGIANRQKVAY
jgi:hypothetical protein